jgi:hypothetical protein
MDTGDPARADDRHAHQPHALAGWSKSIVGAGAAVRLAVMAAFSDQA